MVHNRGGSMIYWKGGGHNTQNSFDHSHQNVEQCARSCSEIERVGTILWGRFEFLSSVTVKSCWEPHLPCLEGHSPLSWSTSIYFAYMGEWKWRGGAHTPCVPMLDPPLHKLVLCLLQLRFVSLLGNMWMVQCVMYPDIQVAVYTFCWGSSPMLTLIVALPPYISTLQKYKQW